MSKKGRDRSCRVRKHRWGAWQRNVYPLPVVGSGYLLLGWQFRALPGRTYRRCRRKRCALLQEAPRPQKTGGDG